MTLMNDEDGFIRAIQAAPDDDARLLIYADWLDERGDPRAEYLRLACAFRPIASKPLVGVERATRWQRLQQLRTSIDVAWMLRTGCLLHFLSAADASERLDELEYFIAFWYGPRQPDYGEPPERVCERKLPYPLRRFYGFAGRWPAPELGYGMIFFYTGAAGHHLYDLDYVRELPAGKLRFFMEYQGDWYGMTRKDGEDPPVWIGRKQVDDTLSKFLITHCLMTTVYEIVNAGDSAKSVSRFENPTGDAALIWQSNDCECPSYQGKFFLAPPRKLVHEYRY